MFKLFRKANTKTTEPKSPQVRIVDFWDTPGKLYAPGALIEVKNGKGILKEVFIEQGGDSRLTLALFETPICQLNGGDYYCPTCEKILKNAGNSHDDIKPRDVLNENNDDLRAVVTALFPMFELLKSGYYVILDTDLFPTDGEGKLFCQHENNDVPSGATAPYYFRDTFEYDLARPAFMVASQSNDDINEERVDYYLNNPKGRALAFHMDGYITSLIDGHHKSLAAALRHEKVSALVICPTYIFNTCNGEKSRSGIHYGISWYDDEYDIDVNISNPEEDKIDTITGRMMNQQIDSYKISSIPARYEGLSEYFPDYRDFALLNTFGKVDDDRIERIITHKEAVSPSKIKMAIRCAIICKASKLLDLAGFFFHEFAYDTAQCRYDVIKELLQLPMTDELQAFLIEVMIDIEDRDEKNARLIFENI